MEKGSIITHERSFKQVIGHKDLIRGINLTSLTHPILDLNHAIDARKKNNEDSSGDCLNNDWAFSALKTIQSDDHKLPQRSPEEESQNESHLGCDHSEEKLNHRRCESVCSRPFLSALGDGVRWKPYFI